jgi:hypothetical protein
MPMPHYTRRTIRLIAALPALLLAAWLPSVAGAAPDEGRLVGERPHAGGPPEEIIARFGLLDIDNIDDKEQRFSIDAYFELSWRDPRLAIVDDEASGSGVRTFSFDSIWTPGLTIVNNRGLSLLLPEVADVDNDGNVVVRQRLSGPLAVDLNLQDFPFDTQRFAIDVVSYRHLQSELVFSSEIEFIANPSSFSVDGWQFEALQPEFSVFRLRDDGAGTAMLSLAVQGQRIAGFYVLTLALPMTLILFLAWTVHWLQPSVIPPRIGMSTATVFSLIALGVSFRLSLPQIDYLTKADRFVMFCTLLVLVSLAITVIATRWVNQDRAEEAGRLTDYTSRAFPLVFAVIVALTLGI